MPYVTINGTEYMVREGTSRTALQLIEVRRRAVDGSLLVDRIAEKIEATLEFAGPASTGTLFTPAEADAFMATLAAANVTVGGSFASFTARARDIGAVDISDRSNPADPVVYRFVTATFDEV